VRAFLWIAVGIFLVLAAISSGFDASDGRADLQLAEHILTDHSVAFNTRPNLVSIPSPNGHWYLIHDVGNAVPMIPEVAVVRLVQGVSRGRLNDNNAMMLEIFIVELNAAVYVAIAAAACFVLARLYGVAARVALFAALAMAGTTLMLEYSRDLFDGVLAGALLILAVCAAAQYRKHGWRRWALVAGLLCGACLATRITGALAIPALALFIYQGRHARDIRGTALFGLGVAPFVAWQMWYDWVRSGNPFISGAMVPQANNPYGSLVAGLAGHLFSPGKSIFIYAPLVLLVPWGIRQAWKKDRALTLLIAWLVISYMVVVSSVSHWYGEGWGPRYFVLVEPLVFPIVGLAIARLLKHRAGIVAVAALSIAGAAVNLPAVLGNWHFRWQLQEARTGTTFPFWDLSHAQWVDMWGGLVHNILYVAGRAPELIVPSYSSVNSSVSNSINFWWLSARFAHVPVAAAAFLATLLALAGVAVLVRAWKQLGGGRPQLRSPAG
jgi:hypothetical protein